MKNFKFGLKSLRRSLRFIQWGLVVILVFGCANNKNLTTGDTDPNRLHTVRIVELNHEVQVWFVADEPLAYLDLAPTDSERILLHLPNTRLDLKHPVQQPTTSRVGTIGVSEVIDHQPGVKVEIPHHSALPHRMIEHNGALAVVIKMPPDPLSLGKTTLAETDTLDAIASETPPPNGKTDGGPAEGVKTSPTDPAFEILGGEVARSYTGEKIAIDFHETDIRNVFRMLAKVGQQNFAIDPDVNSKVTLHLDQPVPWDQVLDLVCKMNRLVRRREGNVIRITTLTSLKAEETDRQALLETRRATEKASGLLTAYLSVNYANAAKDILPHIEAIISKNSDGSPSGRISVDTRNNTLLLTDNAEVIERAEEIIRALDRVTPQVVIEARIVEASTEFSRNIGLQWQIEAGIQGDSPRAGIGPQRGFDRFEGTHGYKTDINFPFQGDTPPAVAGFNFTKIAGSPFKLDAQLQAMESNNEGRIISAPRILTLDNQEAIIKQGLEYPYFEESESGGRTVKFKDVNLELKVKPHITRDHRVTMEITIFKNDIGGFVEGVPYISTKEARTELLINDNDTIVIGGIVKTSRRDGMNGLPWLSRIPILGWLFKTDSKDRKKEELLVFITPKIVQLAQIDTASTFVE
jgi:type IV pilus assembly protein PilQ